MFELSLQRIPFNSDADSKLRLLKSRTALAANIICRLGLCLSLEEPSLPPNLPIEFKHGREINRYTLLGKYDHVYIALLKTRLKKDGISLDKIDTAFINHLHRGLELLSARVKTIEDIGYLS